MSDMKRALKYQQRGYDIRRKLLPPSHPDLATSLNNRGRIHQELAHCSGGDQVEYDKALKDYEAALRIRLKSLPIDH
ncbi:unnamed protein product, partial [Rotaria magnacalcarata]